MSGNQHVATMELQSLLGAWGGRLPTWDEFKAAEETGRIQVNKAVAAQDVKWGRIPPIRYMVLYCVVAMWASILVVPASAGMVFLMGWSWWTMVGAAVLAAFLWKFSREGHCEGIKAAAVADENVYTTLASRGAFLFHPPG